MVVLTTLLAKKHHLHQNSHVKNKRLPRSLSDFCDTKQVSTKLMGDKHYNIMGKKLQGTLYTPVAGPKNAAGSRLEPVSSTTWLCTSESSPLQKSV